MLYKQNIKHQMIHLGKNLKINFGYNKKGTTLIISHQEKILSIADSIILMKNGKIVNMGKKSEVMKDLNFDNSCPVIGGYKNEWFR